MLKYLQLEINNEIKYYKFYIGMKNLLISINKIRYEIFNSKNEINDKEIEIKFNYLNIENDENDNYYLYINRILKECKLNKHNKKRIKKLY